MPKVHAKSSGETASSAPVLDHTLDVRTPAIIVLQGECFLSLNPRIFVKIFSEVTLNNRVDKSEPYGTSAVLSLQIERESSSLYYKSISCRYGMNALITCGNNLT